MKKDVLKALTMLTQVGISVAAPVILCIWISGYLCRKYGIGSWLVILGAILGAAAGFLNLLKLSEIMNKGDK